VPELPARPSDDGPVLTVVCRDFVELVTEYLEGRLPAEVERAVVAHLDLCDPCVVYLEQMRRTSAVLGTLPVPTLAPAARERLLDVFSALHGPAAEPG
jgi:anti-sigma factor RsiW